MCTLSISGDRCRDTHATLPVFQQQEALCVFSPRVKAVLESAVPVSPWEPSSVLVAAIEGLHQCGLK